MEGILEGLVDDAGGLGADLILDFLGVLGRFFVPLGVNVCSLRHFS